MILRRTTALVLAVLAIPSLATAAHARWTAAGAGSASARAIADWVAPSVDSTVIAKTAGYVPGFVKQGGTYFVYANVTDSGNPASGPAAAGEVANVTTITPAGSAVTLAAGSYSVGGVTYNYRSASQTATTPLAGSKGYSISSLDVAANSRSQAGYTVMVENTAPTAAEIQTTNGGGGTAGRAQPGDTIIFTYSEQIDPQSILSGWTGTSVNMVVRLNDGGCLIVCGDDTVTVWNAANNALLPFGPVNLDRSDYHEGGLIGASGPISFGASGSASTMVQSGSTITITLGTGSGTADTAGGNGTMTWEPTTSPYDVAGNAATSTDRDELGAGDKDF